MTGRAPAQPQRHQPPADAWHDAGDLRWAARHWAARTGVRLARVHVRPMRTKWASISTHGRLTLDAGLIALPCDLGELVIVHELVHLLAPNHSKLFKSFMTAHLPDWEDRHARLLSAPHPHRPAARR